MSWSITLGRVFGIDIKMHLTFLFILVWGAFAYGGNAGPLYGVIDQLICSSRLENQSLNQISRFHALCSVRDPVNFRQFVFGLTYLKYRWSILEIS